MLKKYIAMALLLNVSPASSLPSSLEHSAQFAAGFISNLTNMTIDESKLQ